MRCKPLVVDLFCGLGGWSEAFLAEGWDAIGFDNERHDYGSGGYPGQLVLQDVCTIHGAQLIDADCLVASSPCQEFSYRAQPWKVAKAQDFKDLGIAQPTWWKKSQGKMNTAERAEWECWKKTYPVTPPVLGINLFWQAFRIQHEIYEACGRHVPLVAENVRGAQPWVGRAAYNYGSFYLWGDIPVLMPLPVRAQKFNPDGTNHGTGSWFKIADSKNRGASEGLKVPGLDFSGWFDTGIAKHSSRSDSRKAASAQIAKIPQPLAQHIAKVYKPEALR